MSKLKEYNDALDNYYTLKQKYEKSIKKKNKDNDDISKITCVKCKKKGGTDFSRVVETASNGRKQVFIVAKCKADNPCDLNINIKLANYKLYDDLVKSINKQVEIIKSDIIKLKLDLLFQLKDEEYVVTRFEKLKTKMQTLSNKLTKLQNTYNEKNNTFIIKKKDDDTNEEYEEKISKKDSIKITNKEIETVLSNYGKIVKEYNKTKNKAFLNDAFEKYYKQITDLFSKKRGILYQECNIEVIKAKRKEDDNETFIEFRDVSIENKQVSLNAFEIVKNVY
jgi:hypothetical protein